MFRLCRLLSLVLVVTSLSLAADPPAKAKAKAKVAAVTGSITAVDATKKSLSVAGRNGQVTVLTDGKTQIFINDEAAEFSALKVAMKIRVAGVKQGDAVLARRIIDDQTMALYEAENDGVNAVIETLPAEGKASMTVTTDAGKRREVLTSAATQVMKDGQKATLADFKQGDKVMVSIRRDKAGLSLHALADPLTFNAYLKLRTVQGKVKAVTAKQMTLTVEGDKDAVEVKLTKNTKYFNGGAAAASNPFKVGDAVVVKFTQKAKGVISARAIFAPDSWKAYGESLSTEKPKPTPAP